MDESSTFQRRMITEMEHLDALQRWNARSDLVKVLREMASKVGLNFDHLIDLGTLEATVLVLGKYGEVVGYEEFSAKVQQILQLRDEALQGLT